MIDKNLPKILFLLGIILATIVVGLPYLDFQDLVSCGDHGRDLYASVAVYQGDLPFKDFWWVYGPLMPYYYGLFFLVLGFKITSILVAKLVLKIACGVLFYLAGCVVMSPLWAFVAALWFVQSQADFFFTYNHIGGIVLTIGVMGMGLNYLKTSALSFAWGALGLIALLGLVKINFACSAGAAIGLAFILNWITNPVSRRQALTLPHKLFFTAAVIGLPFLWFIIYMFFLRGLSIAEIRQCLPYLGGDQPYNYPPSFTIPYYVTQHWLTITHQWKSFQQLLSALQAKMSLLSNTGFLVFFTASFLNLLLHPLWHGATLGAFISQARKKIDGEKQRLFWVYTLFLLGFFILNFHEFVFSGVWYRSFWTQPMLVMFHFLTVSTVALLLPKFFRVLILSLLGALLAISFIVQSQTLSARKTPQQRLTSDRAQIYVGNEPAWVDTVNTVTAFLTKTLKPGEQFFALPYDTIYYYLTNTKSPTRQLIFFDHIKIPPEQERSIIAELEKNQPAYVLMSNRIASNETGLGIFGKTYCPQIYQYITSTYVPIFKYGGNWQAEPGWANNHGVIIFKRK